MKIKRLVSLVVTLIYIMSISVLPNVSAETEVQKPYDLADGSFAVRDDFLWGVGVHDKVFYSYKEEYLEDYIHWVARTGMKCIRIAIRLGEDMSHYDKTVGLCNAYGLTTFAVFQPSMDLGLDYITLAVETVCRRYDGKEGRGKIDYIQVWNETDTKLMVAKSSSGIGDGRKPEHYFTIPVDGLPDLPEYLEYFKAAQKGVDNSGSDVKFMTNMSYRHWYAYRYYLDHGVKFDAIGCDWYAHRPTYEEAKAEFEETCDLFEEEILKDYPLEVIICETNTDMYSVGDLTDFTLEDHFPFIGALEVMYSRPWIKAITIYELLDEPEKLESSRPIEGGFGLIENTRDGVIGDPKPIYYELRRLIGTTGYDTDLIPESSLNLKPYEKLIVDNADDSQLKEEPSETPDIDIPVFNLPEVDENIENNDPEVDENIENDVVKPTEESKNQIKQLNTTKTVYAIPWLFVIISSVAILLLAGGAIALYFILLKRKNKISSD